MSKVVYLMGAGASFGTRAQNVWAISSGIPIVSEIPRELDTWGREINATTWGEHALYKYKDFEVDLPEAQNKLSNDFKWLAAECANHSTIDTFAKKLFLTGNGTDYKRLKRALTAFLLVEQIAHKSDMRYDAFFANILNKERLIPDDIAIITWNYDSQFEIALSGYGIRLTDMKYSPICLPVYNDESHNQRYKIFKINGSATFSDDRPISDFCKPTQQNLSDKELKREVLWYYGNSKLTPDLSFAWEEEQDSSYFYRLLEEQIKNATTMVVVGYTFPYFNRETDRRVIAMMRNLKRIIIQDPNAEAIVQNVEATFQDYQLVNKIKIEPYTHTQSFIIPREL